MMIRSIIRKVLLDISDSIACRLKLKFSDGKMMRIWESTHVFGFVILRGEFSDGSRIKGRGKGVWLGIRSHGSYGILDEFRSDGIRTYHLQVLEE